MIHTLREGYFQQAPKAKHNGIAVTCVSATQPKSSFQSESLAGWQSALPSNRSRSLERKTHCSAKTF